MTRETCTTFLGFWVWLGFLVANLKHRLDAVKGLSPNMIHGQLGGT